MIFAWTPYALPFLVATFFTGAVAIHVARHRDTAVTPPFVVLLGSISLWMLLEGLTILGVDLPTKSRLAHLCYLPVVLIGPSLFVMAMRSHEPPARPGLVRWGLILSVPIVSVGFVFLDTPSVGLIRSLALDPGAPYPRRLVEHGPWYVAVVAHGYVLVGWASVLIARKALSTRRQYGNDSLVMLVGVLVPWVGVSAHLMEKDLLPYIDAAPFGFLFTACCLVWGFERTGLLGVMGVGRRLVMDAMGDGVLVIDTHGKLVDVNRAARRILGLEGVHARSQAVDRLLVHQPQLLAMLERIPFAWATARDASPESRQYKIGAIDLDVGDSSLRSFDLQVSKLCNDRGLVVCRVLVLHDITERKRTEDALERDSGYIQLMQEVALAANEAASVESALETAVRLICERMGWAVGHVYRPAEARSDELVSAGIYHLSDEERFLPLARAPQIRRVERGQGLPGRVLLSGRPEFVAEFDDAHRGARQILSESFGLRSAVAFPVTIGDEVPAVLEFAATDCMESPEDLASVLVHLGSLLGRVIERKRSEEQIRDLAFYDPLTKLPNRQLFQRRLASALVQAERHERTVGLLFIDLDGFKMINDTLGHSAGDILLRRVSERFRTCTREKDLLGFSRGDLEHAIARLGGDEFTVLLGDLRHAEDAAMVADRLIRSLAAPFLLAGSEVLTSASVGIAIYPEDGEDAEGLLRSADTAMYEAKALGASRYQFYAESMNRRSLRHLQLGARLRRTLDEGGLSLYFQPQRDTRSGRVVGAEALARWTDAEFGKIEPGEFIPIAESAGLINRLGAWVLGQACRQAREWQQQGYRPIRMAINVSGYQIRSGDLLEAVENALVETDLLPRWLEVELTESAIQSDDPITRATLDALHGLGVELALDDFGTGSSSLTHLRSFPMDHVKIDREFVRGVPEDLDDASLTSAIIAMAHGLRRRVIAEGVESEAQARFLAARGCDELQGHLIGRPVPAAEFVRYLERAKPEPEPEPGAGRPGLG